jgi:hypothetical protein
MTYYKRYSDEQRNDPELRKMVARELACQRTHLTKAMAHLEEAYKELNKAVTVEEDIEIRYSSGIQEARVNVFGAMRRFSFYLDHPATETYIGNVAAAMSAEQIAELKEKYNKNSTCE